MDHLLAIHSLACLVGPTTRRELAAHLVLPGGANLIFSCPQPCWNAKRYLDGMHSTPPRIILLEIGEGHLSAEQAIDALDHLRVRVAEAPQISIVLSRDDSDVQVAACYDAGCNFVIQVPVEQAGLTECLAAVTGFLELLTLPTTRA